MEFNFTDRKEYRKHVEEIISKGPFSDNWDSLTDYRIPKWFEDAKFGIFIHWGVYSVPAFGTEWYSRMMYVKDSNEYKHHIETYGPQSEFGYKDFIPMFKAEKFDADYWIDVFKKAGAKYVVPVAEHHDGFQMYKSFLSHYNASEMGPKKDIVGLLKEACEKQGLKIAASTHRAEHQWFMGVGREFDSDIKEPLNVGDFYWPSVPQQPDFQDLYAKPDPTEEFLEDWLLRTCEIIDRYQPAVLYFDWWIEHNAYKPYLKKIAAYYYNQGINNNFPTAICYKHDAFAFGAAVLDVERGKLATATPFHWQTDTAIARNSWCHTNSLDYKTGLELICYLIDVVSKNGNLLLNVGPKADGSFADEDLKILGEIGDWLSVNGEAIYNSKPWKYSQEGPTKEIEGQFTDAKATEYTSEDFRFTTGNGAIYATCLNYPDNGEITIKSLSLSEDPTKPAFHGIIKNVSVLGSEETPEYCMDKDGLHIKTKSVKSDYPVVIKVMTE